MFNILQGIGTIKEAFATFHVRNRSLPVLTLLQIEILLTYETDNDVTEFIHIKPGTF